MLTESLIIGAGGHSKVVIEAIRQQYKDCRILLVDQDISKQGMHLLDGIQVKYLESWTKLPAHYHVAIGDNDVRQQLAGIGREKKRRYISVIHPGSDVSPSARLGDGCFVATQAVIAAQVMVDEGCIVNHGSIIDHDCFISSYSHIAPGAILSGGVQVGKSCIIGAGAIILPMITIGDHVTVGAGAVVTSDVPAGQTVVGMPARCRKSDE